MKKLISFFLIISAINAIENDNNANNLALIDWIKALPLELQKDILIQSKQTEDHHYYPSIDSFVTFKLGSTKENNKVIEFYKNSNKIFFKKLKKFNSITSANMNSFIAGPNKNNLVTFDNTIFQFDAEDNFNEFKFKLRKSPYLIHPEKNYLITKNFVYPDTLWNLYMFNDNNETSKKLKLPHNKIPFAFGPENLLWMYCFDKNLSFFELYDFATQTTYEKINFFNLLQKIPVVPTIQLSNASSGKYFLFEYKDLRVDYFPEFKNTLLFSFRIANIDQNSPFYFALYDIENKSCLYLGSSNKQTVQSLVSGQKDNQHAQEIPSRKNKELPTQENHFFVEKLKPENITNQLVALELIGKTYKWLQEENPSLDEGQKILQTFHNQNFIKNKYKLIWQTTTPEHGNIFKKVYEKVKELENSK